MSQYFLCILLQAVLIFFGRLTPFTFLHILFRIGKINYDRLYKIIHY